MEYDEPYICNVALKPIEKDRWRSQVLECGDAQRIRVAKT